MSKTKNAFHDEIGDLPEKDESKMVVKHTPGPWSVGIEDEPMHQVEGIEINANDGADNIAYAMSLNDDFKNCDITRANARLIAAAPDLLEALETILNSDMAMREEDDDRDKSPQLEKARAAIAKARNEGGV